MNRTERARRTTEHAMFATRAATSQSASAKPDALRRLLIEARELMQRHAWAQARPLLERAVGPLAGIADVWLALAEVCHHMGDTAGSVAAAQRTLALDPRSLLACLLAGLGLMRLHRMAEALRVFEAFPPELAANCVNFHVPYGEALRLAGRPQDSVNTLMTALGIQIDHAHAHCQLGFAFRELGMDAEAAECFRTVTALNPHSLPGHAYMVHWEQFSSRWQDFDRNVQGFIAALHHAAETPEMPLEYCAPFALVGLPHHPLDMLQAARLSARFMADKGPPLSPMPPRQPQPPGAQRIRIGYLSSDFHTHATSLLLVEVLERRDRSRFEVVLFSHGIDDESPLRRRIESACDRFVDVRKMTVSDTARAIRAAGIDILVDLKGYTTDTRIGAFTWRPAPVQVTWLGFPGTTGAEFIDYLIGDPIVTPLDHAPWYSEKIAQMPVCYQPNDSHRPRPGPGPISRRDWELPEEAFVLGSFNQAFKITPRVFDVWMDVLRRIDGAVLWQLYTGEQARDNLRAEAARRGVDPGRIVFAPKVRPDEHLARIAAADLVVDTWPCNGHTTTSDALWAGVPVVTFEGLTFASRVAPSLLSAVGLGELVCRDERGYADLVVALAQEPQRLGRLKQHLAMARDSAPLFDAAHFARDLEALYTRMWDRHAAGLAPAALPACVGVATSALPAQAA